MASYDDTATVSGSVVSFLNGADDVPLKSCEVALPASLDGYSSVDVVSAGKNLLNYIDYSNSYGITSVTDNGSGSFTVVANVVAAYIDHVIEVKAGETYVIKCVSATNDAGNASQIGTVNVYDGDNSSAPILLEGASINYSKKTFTPTGNKILCRNKVTGGLGGGTGTIVEPQLEIGSTATAYEPYTAPTTHTANLGRTIYGGQVDIVNGEGTDGYAKDSMTSTYLSGLSSSYIGYEASTNYFGGHPTIWVRNWNYQTAKIRQAGGIGCVCNYFPVSMHNTDIINTQNRIYFDVNGKGISDVAGFIAFVQNLEANNESLDIVYELETKTDFTFEPVEISSKLGDNTMWSEQGNTELTYYKSGYGFTSVTVNKTGKNLIDETKFTRGLPSTTIGANIDTITTSNRFAYYGVRAGGGSLTVSSTSSDADYFNLVLIYGYKNGVLTYYSNAQAGTSKTVDFSDCDYVRIGIGSKAGTPVPTDLTGYGTIQLELGSQATEYEPYEAVSKTAYLHKVIYGGTADVVKGTCEPKNLLKNTLTNTTVNGTTFTVNNGVITISGTPSAQTRVYIKQGEAYTVDVASYFSSGAMPTGTRVFSKKVSGGTTTYPTLSPTSSMATVGDVFSDILLEINTTYDGTEFSIYPQIEHGSSASDYTPYFEPFTFPPVSMETDEGENNLFANEGDSAITYRKAVD